jgi:type II secretory pathway component PulF
MAQWLLFKSPLVGSVVYSYWLALFLRSCGTMIESGTSVAESYASAVTGIGFVPLSVPLGRRMGSLSQGVSLASVLSSSEIRIPQYIPALVSAGESSGTLGISLIRAADIVDRDIEHRLKRLTSLIEPVMMAAMGCMVGAIALSIMMPIYDISKVLQR